MEWLYYLLKVSGCLLLFLGSYVLFLKKLSFFKANRIYLMGTLFLSFIIPLLKFEWSQHLETTRFFGGYDPVAQVSSKSLAPILLNQELNSFNIADWIFYAYLLMMAMVLVRSFFKVSQLIRHTHAEFSRINDLKVIDKKTGFANCSFFNYVFIDSSSLTPEETQILLKHEEVHARQFHTLDKLVLLLFKAVLWFNPLIYWYEKAVEEVHEFEADALTANEFSADLYANLLLKMATKKQVNPVLHSFSQHPLKDRMGMLFASSSKTGRKWSYLIMIPLMICLSWLFAFKVPERSTESSARAESRGGDRNFVLILDAGHGGKDNGAENRGLLEKDLTLLMQQKLSRMAKERNLKVVTTRDMDQYLSLKDRVEPKGDLLISLHVNQNQDAAINGIELLRGNAGADTGKAEKLNQLSYQLYKNLSKLKGIAVNNTPKELKGLYILDKSIPPSMILELGYLTHQQDRDYLTNPDKQEELVHAILHSILDYQQTLQKDK